ncbi:hypothetical protein EDB89DRAFT_1909173, partial [Lactarius sanguifluus]
MVLQGHIEDVLSYPIQSAGHLHLRWRLLHVVTYDNEVATNIDVLEVDHQVADGVTFRAIQAVLDRTPNISSLVLQLSFRCFHIFPNVTVFENLINLTALVATVNAVPCWSVNCRISGPSPVHPAVHPHFPIIKAFNFGIIGTLGLTTLHKDFDHTSAHLLHRISAVAPVLINLKLTEKCMRTNATGRSGHTGRWLAVTPVPREISISVLKWLILTPPNLHDVGVMTGARQDQCRLVFWNVDDQGKLDDLWQETDDLFDKFEKRHEDYHKGLEATNKSAVRRADDIKDLGSALKEHETRSRGRRSYWRGKFGRTLSRVMAVTRRKPQMRGAIRFKERGLEYKNIGSTVGVKSVSNIWYISSVVKREAGSPDRRQTGGNAPPDTTTSSQTTHCTGEPVRTQAWAYQEDELARSLEDCLSIFRSGLLHDIHIEGLVFWEPSKKDDLHPPPPLQRLAKANTQFLEYCKWIKKMLINCQNLDCGTFEHCRSIRDQLLHDIQNEWIKLDDLQLHTWQMVSQKDRSVPMPSDPGLTVNNFGSMSMQVIDTFSGLSLRDCSQLLFTIQFLINLMVEDFRVTDSQGKYLAKSMLCCPGMEDMMDRDTSPLSGGVMEDIWDVPGLYKIPGADGHPFICKRADNKGRYLFSFNMDGFNPFQLKQAGRSATVMGLYM